MKSVNFTPFPILETDSFILRRLTQEDKNEIFTLRSDKRVLTYLDISVAKTVEDAEKFIERIDVGIEKNEWINWAITRKNQSCLAGTISLWNFDTSRTKADIGFSLLPENMGKGIMQEIIPAVIDYGFNILGLERIEGEVFPGNIKSIKLMERFGFVFHRKYKQFDVYSLTTNGN